MRQYVNIARHKGKLLVRELIDGKESRIEAPSIVTMYNRSNKKTDMMNFYQDGYVYPKDFGNGKDLKDYIDTYADIEGEVWGNTDPIIQYIYNAKYDCTDFTNLIYSILDIEVCTRLKDENGNWIDGGFPNADEANYPINAICDYRSNTKKYHVFTTAKWEREKSQLPYVDEVEYIYCIDEKDLLKKWITFWKNDIPHIISGWNNKSFDIPYIVNRITKLFSKDVANILSPWRIIDSKVTKNNFGSEDKIYNVLGIATLDYLDLYKKYRYKPREKYTLDFISTCELKGEHKLHFNGTHGTLYWDDPQFFVDYNIQDVRCVVKFEEIFQFMKLASYISYFAGTNIEDNYSPIKIWETLLYTNALRKNIVLPYRKSVPDRQSYEGAYVHTPIPGFKGAVASFDYTSLYPSIIMFFYTGADTILRGENKANAFKCIIDTLKTDKSSEAKEMLSEIERTGIFNEFYIHNHMPKSISEFLHNNNLCLTTNCEFFDVSKKSVFVELVNKLFKERKSDKKTSFAYKHKAQEIKEILEKRGITVD